MSQFIYPEDRTPKAWLRPQSLDDYESDSLVARLLAVALIGTMASGIICGLGLALALFMGLVR